jgi:hypothetical protein
MATIPPRFHRSAMVGVLAWASICGAEALLADVPTSFATIVLLNVVVGLVGAATIGWWHYRMTADATKRS